MRNGDDLNAVFENSVNEIERKRQENKAPLTFPCYRDNVPETPRCARSHAQFLVRIPLTRWCFAPDTSP
jgi:hypothetical protein